MRFFTLYLLIAVASILLELTQVETICSAVDSVYSFKIGKWDAAVMNDGGRPGLNKFFTN